MCCLALQNEGEAQRASERLGHLWLSHSSWTSCSEGKTNPDCSSPCSCTLCYFLPLSGPTAPTAQVSALWLNLLHSRCAAYSVKPQAADRDRPHVLELSSFMSAALTLSGEGVAQQLPSTITRRGASNHKPSVPESTAASRELQDAAQSRIHSHPTWLSGPRESCIAF